MADKDIILEVRDLKKYFKSPTGTLHAVDDISFSIERGRTLGVVGAWWGSPAAASPPSDG